MIQQGCVTQDTGRSKFACGVEWEECGSCGEEHPVDAEEHGYFDCRQDCFRGVADYCRKCEGFHPLGDKEDGE